MNALLLCPVVAREASSSSSSAAAAAAAVLIIVLLILQPVFIAQKLFTRERNGQRMP